MLWGGAYRLLENYPLTRDEHMVVFDMAVFRSGHLAYPLAAGWRPYAQALTPAFLLPLPGNAAWVSSYMPVNAMLHAAFGFVFDPALLNPFLAALGAIALFDVAQRLFPDSRSAQLIALLVYGTSAQVLVSAMTVRHDRPFGVSILSGLPFTCGERASVTDWRWASAFLRSDSIRSFSIRYSQHRSSISCGGAENGGQLAAYLGSYTAFLLFWISYPHLVSASSRA